MNEYLLRFTHERGQSTRFVWSTLNETFSQVRSPEGIAGVSKNQPAVALKVSTLVLSEKQIGMQEAEFEEASRQLINDLYRVHDHLKRTDPDHHEERTIASPEFTELIGFARRRFVWQAGTYTVSLALRLAGIREATTQEFRFTLTNNDIDRMRENLQTIEQYVRDLIQPPDEPRTHRWNWAYPPFLDSQLPVPSKA